MEAGEHQLEVLARRFEHRVGFFAGKVQRSYMLGSRYNDDLISAGYWGLFKALRNRRPEAHERELSAYVSMRIHGAVIDAARLCLGRVRTRELSMGVPGDEEPGHESDHTPSCAWAWQQAQADPEETAQRVWRQTAIRNALDQLDANERRVLVAYMEGASVAEIAGEEGVAVGTMQARFQRLSRMLRARAPELRRILLDREQG